MRTKVDEMFGEKLPYRAIDRCRAPRSVDRVADSCLPQAAHSPDCGVGSVRGRSATTDTTAGAVARASRLDEAGVR